MRLRNKATDILMIIGLSISFFVATYGMGIYNTAVSSKTTLEKVKFENQYNFMLSDIANYTYEGDIDIDEETHTQEEIETFSRLMESILDVTNGNVVMPWGVIAGQAVLPVDVFLYMEMNEKTKMELDWGTFPSQQMFEQKMPVIVVNNAMLNYAQRDGEKYFLEIYGENYEVIGVLDDAYQTYALGEVIMFYDCLGARTKKQVCEDVYSNLLFGYEFKYESDKDIKEEYEGIKEKAKENGLKCSYASTHEDESDWFTEMILKLKGLFSIFMYLLSAVNCASISFLWIRHRMNEYSVRKAFGYNTSQLYCHVMKEFCPLVFASGVFVAIIHLINLCFFDARIFSGENIVLLAAIMLLSVVVAISIPLKIVSKVKPATGIKEL